MGLDKTGLIGASSSCISNIQESNDTDNCQSVDPNSGKEAIGPMGDFWP